MNSLKGYLLCATHDKAIWFFSNTYKEVNSEITAISNSPYIKFHPAKVSQSGYYYCHGTYSEGNFFLSASRLKVYGKLRIPCCININYYNGYNNIETRYMKYSQF